MFCSTRPRPGKCLSVAATPCSSSAVVAATTCSPTASGSVPKPRSRPPTGSLAPPSAGSTTSATGARATWMPSAERSSPMLVYASVVASTPCAPSSSADGVRRAASPRSIRTCPPSWSTAIRAGRSGRASSCAIASVASTVSALSQTWSRNRPPAWCSVSTSCGTSVPAGIPTSTSWPASSRGERLSSSCSAAVGGSVVGASVGSVAPPASLAPPVSLEPPESLGPSPVGSAPGSSAVQAASARAGARASRGRRRMPPVFHAVGVSVPL